jgi:hypothetical protein
MARQPLGGLGRLIFRGFTITFFRQATLDKTPLDEGPARRRDLYLTTHNTHKRQTSIPPVGFKPTILVSELPHTHALDRTATGIGTIILLLYITQNLSLYVLSRFLISTPKNTQNFEIPHPAVLFLRAPRLFARPTCYYER